MHLLHPNQLPVIVKKFHCYQKHMARAVMQQAREA